MLRSFGKTGLLLSSMYLFIYADPTPVSLTVSFIADTVWLHVEPMSCDTSSQETLEVCDAMIDAIYYPAMARELQKPVAAGPLKLCCKEPGNSYLELRTQSTGPVRIYLWGCNLSTGTMQIGEATFTLDFGPELTRIISQTFQQKKVIQLTGLGKQQSEERKRDAMVVLLPLIQHINSFSGRRLDTIERFQQYGLSAPRISSLSKMVANLKAKAKEGGVAVIWDSTELRYSLPEDNK
jgi:hypothetical protein